MRITWKAGKRRGGPPPGKQFNSLGYLVKHELEISPSN
jgi:hypothetical protein